MKRLKFLILCSFIILTGCNKNNKKDTLKEKLEAMDGVTSVSEIDQDENIFKQKYKVTIKQQIDRNDASVGYFEQTFNVGFQSFTQPTVFRCGGYFLYDVDDPREEIATHYNANFIDIEYRYFGESTPLNLSYNKTDLWEYLTSENASNDFHHIITGIKNIFKGPTVFTGTSKGGFTTEVQAMYYPDDIDAYVSYVAPLCDGVNDDRFYKNIYETIGNLTYGEVQASIYRQECLDFQILCFENKDALKQSYYDFCVEQGDVFKSDFTADYLFDYVILDSIVGIWQYYQDFTTIENILKMPREDDPITEENEKEILIDTLLNYLMYECGSGGFSSNCAFVPYVFQSLTQMGNYKMDFSYIRNALKEKDEEYLLSITPEQENDPLLYFRPFLSDEILANFNYSDVLRNKLINWSQTTTKDIIKVVGQSDTWYAVRMPEVSNEHIHLFEVEFSHLSNISYLSNEKQDEAWSLMDKLLKK